MKKQSDFVEQKDAVEQKNVIAKIRAIEKYICENFEELDLDNPVEIVYVAPSIYDLLLEVHEELGLQE